MKTHTYDFKKLYVDYRKDLLICSGSAEWEIRNVNTETNPQHWAGFISVRLSSLNNVNAGRDLQGYTNEQLKDINQYVLNTLNDDGDLCSYLPIVFNLENKS